VVARVSKEAGEEKNRSKIAKTSFQKKWTNKKKKE
jgi:hypothetical protein